MKYLVNSAERLQMMFNFQANQHFVLCDGCGGCSPLVSSLNATKNRPATAQWGQFLRNHDELDLGRLLPKQRQCVFDEFGPDANMQLYNRGSRRRLAPMLKGDRRRIELAYSLMFTLPGTPVIRYGDEIGMGDNLKLPERNCARTPMQWSTEPQGGFTQECSSFVFRYRRRRVWLRAPLTPAAQRRDPNSILNWMERMIRMRKEVPEIGWGKFSFIATRTPKVLAMRYNWQTTQWFACITWVRNRGRFASA